MGREKAFEEMVETLNEFGECLVITESGEEYSVAPATDFVGGEEGYYMCDVLGNVMYSNPEEICAELLNNIKEEVVEVEVD